MVILKPKIRANTYRMVSQSQSLSWSFSFGHVRFPAAKVEDSFWCSLVQIPTRSFCTWTMATCGWSSTGRKWRSEGLTLTWVGPFGKQREKLEYGGLSKKSHDIERSMNFAKIKMLNHGSWQFIVKSAQVLVHLTSSFPAFNQVVEEVTANNGRISLNKLLICATCNG